MKTIKFKFIALLVILAGIGGACSLDDSDNYCFQTKATPILGVSGPTGTTVNTPLTLNVTYTPYGSCGAFNTFSQTSTFPKEITLIVDYEGCECPPTEELRTQPYVFTATTPGEYVLKFKTDDTTNPFITKTITVTE